MFQIVFNQLSTAEMSTLPRLLQLELLADLRGLPQNPDDLDPKRFKSFERNGRKLYRCRAKDYRIYFECTNDGIVIHRVLHKNTIRDFLFRSQLPMIDDDELLQRGEIWQLIEEGEASGRK